MRRSAYLVGGVALVTVVAGIAVAASASAGTTTYEAEAAVNTLRGEARAVDCRRCSGGSRVTGIGPQGSLTVTGVTAERTGTTRLAITYTGAVARIAEISVNGSIGTAVRFPASRGASRPATIRVTVTLRAGDNTVGFGNPAGPAPDIDKLVLTTDGTPPGPAPTPAETLAPTVPPTSPPTTSPPVSPTTTAPTSAPAPPSGNAAAEAEVVRLVNVERQQAGCGPLTSDDRLQAAARAHSADMAARDYFSHTTPEGVEFATRITAAGYAWRGAGENIAKGYRTPEAVMTGWMNSAGHKANILNCGFRDLGVGVAADTGGTLLWTQDFGTPR
ncbi:MAG TPA: CAP domain-containing protein [Actinoplanes sp.]|nr:CAP domain-containing protein [Actinoplanes sp.]